MFEVRDKDLAGRIGRLRVGEWTVETPTIMPVVNPNLRTVEPSELPDFGAEIAITNAYILYRGELRDRALDGGLRSVVDFPGPLMTDSGSFQLSVYGDVEVSSREIVEFQDAVGSDLVTPLDVPTAPGSGRARAEADLEVTQRRIEEAVDLVGERAVAPVQGSTHPDLRERAARDAASTGAGYFCVGAIVPLMERYEYPELVDCVVASKRGLPDSAPVHLFGAGHPASFALAVSMGGDLFDSAAYALFARKGRYLTVEGTKFLEEMAYLPCSCPECSRRDVEEMDEEALARHNLHVTFEELRNVKQHVREGRLAELVAQRARSHPHLLAGWRRYFEHVDWVEARDPAVKRKGVLYTGGETSRRPEVARHNRRLARVEIGPRVLFAPHDADTSRFEDDFDVVKVKPPFAYPSELSETYPCGQSVVPGKPDPETLGVTQDAVDRLIEESDFDQVAYLEFPYGLEVPGEMVGRD
ncbi:MAG: tRNA-guanine(15) transglycosylase [Methanonatronarchaeales archaeon]|nr:tRNA-guanine(15) transglycosylase [Methanonatronarchaeales archaeon]